MDIKTKTFVYNVATDCRVRHSHHRLKKRIVRFIVQLEVRHPRRGTWHAAVRFDTAHGFAHRDRLHPNGSVDKTALPVDDYTQALNYAEADLQNQWQVYRDRFLEELEHDE